MKISNNELRRVIRNVIQENYEDAIMPLPIHGGDQHGQRLDVHMQKAQSCIGMAHGSSSKLAEMCVQICNANNGMMAKCFELCMCCCKCDLDGCCRCLSEICSCPQCAQICADCCGC